MICLPAKPLGHQTIIPIRMELLRKIEQLGDPKLRSQMLIDGLDP